MKFALNYIDPEVQDIQNTKSFTDGIYIKYPGGKWDFETLRDLCDSNKKIVLHGIIPSSGSILDPKLCDNIDEWAKFVEETNQSWLSFHLEHKPKYGNDLPYNDVLKNNLAKIKNRFPNMPILIENMPSVDNIEKWCSNADLFRKVCEKYDLGMLLDIPHALISAKNQNIHLEEYLDKFPLEHVKEIHMAGVSSMPDGNYYDSHIECGSNIYTILEHLLPKCKNLEMISLEYSPNRDYDGQTYAAEYRKKHSNEDIVFRQYKQLDKIQEVYYDYVHKKEISKKNEEYER